MTSQTPCLRKSNNSLKKLARLPLLRSRGNSKFPTARQLHYWTLLNPLPMSRLNDVDCFDGAYDQRCCRIDHSVINDRAARWQSGMAGALYRLYRQTCQRCIIVFVREWD